MMWDGSEWILENGWYVNHETGECEKQSRFEEAIKYLTYSTAEIREKTEDYITTALIRKRAVGGGRKPKMISNPFQLSLRGYESFSDIPQWLDDVLTGAGNAHTGNTRISAEMIFHFLKALPFITTALIRTHLNNKRSITTGDVVNSTRYIQELLSSCESAIKSIEYHLERGKDFYTPEYDDFDFEQDAINYLAHVQPTQTIERKIELMLAAGLTVEEINKRSDVIEANAQIKPIEDKSMSLTYEEFKELADRYQRERQERIAKRDQQENQSNDDRSPW